MTDNGTSSNAFLKTVRTTLRVHDCTFLGNPSKSGATCDQDAIVLGTLNGTDTDTEGGLFAGYGLVVERCFFDRIRHAFTLYRDANACIFRDNTIYLGCGGSAPVLIDGTGSGSVGNVFSGNLYELTNYSYGFDIIGPATYNRFEAEGYYDPTAGFVALFRTTGAVTGGNIALPAWNGVPLTKLWELNSAGARVHILGPGLTAHSVMRCYGSEGLALDVYPDLAQQPTTVLARVRRSALESVQPDVDVFQIDNGGGLYLAGPAAGLHVDKGVMDVGSAFGLYRTTSGNLTLDPNATGAVVISRGVLMLPQYATGSRPSASAKGEGQMIWDSTLHKPIFSNGSIWIDAAGIAA